MNIRELFDNRIGKFYINIDHWRLEQKEEIKSIFTKMVILRCECLEFNNRYEYYAVSDLFDKCEKGDQIPEYNIIVSENLVDGISKTEIKFERRT